MRYLSISRPSASEPYEPLSTALHLASRASGNGPAVQPISSGELGGIDMAFPVAGCTDMLVKLMSQVIKLASAVERRRSGRDD
jgi:hypothetical protein